MVEVDFSFLIMETVTIISEHKTNRKHDGQGKQFKCTGKGHGPYHSKIGLAMVGIKDEFGYTRTRHIDMKKIGGETKAG